VVNKNTSKEKSEKRDIKNFGEEKNLQNIDTFRFLLKTKKRKRI